MNAVLAEDTDTPYHRAVKDFAAGRYAEALEKYQAILKDGTAWCYPDPRGSGKSILKKGWLSRPHVNNKNEMFPGDLWQKC